jgi:hypothetical protein
MMDDDDVDGVGLRLWIPATNGTIIRPPGDIWVWRTMVEWNWQEKTPDSSTRSLWQSYPQSSSEAGGTDEGIDEFCLAKNLFRTSKGSLTCRKILRQGANGFTSPLNVGMLLNFFALKIHRSRPVLNPWTLGPMADTPTITPPRTTHTAYVRTYPVVYSSCVRRGSINCRC